MRGGNVEPDQGTCAVCGAAVALTSVLTCPACGSDYGTPAGTAVRQADAALQSIAASEQGLARLREQWLTYRSEQVEHLRRTAPPAQPHRPAPLETFAPPPAYVPPDEEQGLADIPPPAGEPVVAAPAPEPAPSEAAYAGPPAPEPVAAESAEPEPQAAEAAVPPAPASGKRKKSKAAAALTAPALLGVAGASLLIAAAVVFVAIAWTVFSPLARGAVVALVAVAVAGLAVWMRRLGLLVSSGAVGTVAVGFAGAAAIAVARDLPAVGAFDVTLALLVACGAGLALARLRIPWVGSVSALALAGATVTFTVAAVRTSEGAGGTATGSSAWVWSLAGTAAALALASTHRFWRWNVARGAIRWGAVGWLTIVAGASVAWLWWGDGTTPDAIAALAPVAALAVVARTWPLLALGPLAFTLTLVAPAAAATLGADWWEQATVVAVVVAALLAVGSRLQGAGRWAFLAGLAPAYLVVAIASGVYSVSLTVARLLAGTYVPDTNLWAGVAALIAGLSVAQLRQWRMDSRWLDAATIAGAVMVITGTGIVAFGLAELTGPPWYHSSVAVATAAAGAGLLAALRLWWDPRARWVTAAGSLVFVLVSAYYAAWALLMGQAALLMALVIVALPAVVLVARGAVSPWWGWLAAVVVLSADAGALAARYETPLAVQFAAAVAVAAAVVWLARGRYLHSAVLAGTAPAMVLAAASVVWSLDVMVPDGLREGPSPSTWWHAATLLAAVAAAGARRWRVLDGARAHIESAGVVTLAAAALGGAVAAARAWLPDALIVAMVLAAIAVAASTRVWTTERARAAVSATAMVVAALAGLRSLPWLADADQNLVWALVGLAAALAVLAGLAVWRRPAALTAASVLTTLALLAVTMRAEWASGSSMVAVSALVAAIAWAALLVPARLRAAQWWGLAPAVAVMAVVTAGGAVAGALDVLVDWGLASNWWLLAIAASLVVTVVAFRGESRVRQVYPWALTFAYVALVGTLAAAVAPHRVGTSAWVIAVLAIGVAAALGVAAAGARWLWPARAKWPRAAMRYGSMAWTVVAGLGSLIALGRHELGLAAAAAIVLVTAGALAVASMRWRWALSGAVVLVTAVAPALALYGERGLAVLAAVVAAGAWALHAVPARLVRPGVVGLVPGAIVTAAWSLAGISQVVTAVFLDADHARSPWLPVVAGLASVALAAVPQLRPHLLTIVGLGAAVAATALPWWLAPLVIAVLALGLVTYRAGRAGTVPTAMSSTALRAVPPAVAVGIALWAIVYAWSDMWPVAITAAAASAVSVIAARRVLWPAVIAVATAALAGGAAISAAGLDAVAPVAVALGMARALELEWRRIVPAGAAMPVTAGAVVVVATVGAGSGTGAGGALVAAGVGWLGFVAMGRKGSRWVSASLLSLGTALILADAGVRFIEAYMAVPAAAAIIIGVAWMRRSPEVSSLAALGPGLALALVPSYIALALAPDHVLRTAWLVVAIVILAALGVRLRWFALILATATTAVVVAVLQFVAGSNLLARMIAFIIVGTLLLAIASWFERLKTLR